MQNTIYLQKETLSEFIECPYIPAQKMRLEYMYILKISDADYDKLLENGWRRFGCFFFRPNCLNCFKCIPIRLKTDLFFLSKGQKRVIKKNVDTITAFEELNYKKEYFDIYQEHSRERFNQTSNIYDFKDSFFADVVKCYHSNFYQNSRLFASGFIDISKESASSVYFYYRSKFLYLSPGIFGALKEIEFAKKLNLKYYYLGYFISENKSMSYKNKFKPYQFFDWDKKVWRDSE